MKSVHSSVDQPLLANQKGRKYPTLFKWKIGTLVLSIISLLLLIAVIILAVYLSNHPPQSNNSTFITSIIQQSQIISSKKQLNNLYLGLFKHHSFVFTNARKVMSKSSISQSILKDGFSESSKDTLLLWEGTRNNGSRIIFGSYVDSQFPIPSDFNKSQSYYTFDTRASADRLNMLVGLSTPSSIVMNSDSKLSDCKVYQLSSNNFILLSALEIDLAIPQSTIKSDKYYCYNGQATKEAFSKAVEQLVGSSEIGNIKIQMYHLSK